MLAGLLAGETGIPFVVFRPELAFIFDVRDLQLDAL